MTLDLLDHAFIERWNAVVPLAAANRPAPVAPATPVPVPRPAAAPTVKRCTDPVRDDLVDRLLQAAGPEWSSLADAIESARRRGRRAIAIASCESGAGCTTIVAALVRMLHDRGHEAVACDSSSIHGTGPTHGKRIVLVDAGVWFPPGRIHRQRLMVASAGCDAAILVRKGNREPPATWDVALESLGVEPLGEVVSFATPAGSGGTVFGATP
ncbi:MAG: hypothetical protein K8S94_17445 [Planctomycetia bacterium]|nr:hypothetical protein [Planctomycetia bacterium]